ncbi:MAG TPA: Uma2 family endonuclease [Gemmataceae bacterium]|jgi:Uma2 family endonuclease|nr:Uma2 family endonuclease [Gemmataceae bacterium]
MAAGVNGAVRFLHFDELLRNLGGIPPSRVRLTPAPGTATIRDVVRLWKSEGRMCELVEKTLVEKPMAFDESNIAGIMLTWLNVFLTNHPIGMAVGEQGMMKLLPGLVRAPDVSFVSWSQIPDRAATRTAVPDFYPDLAIEVLSKGNTRGEMVRKRKEYFLAGTQLVWEVNPLRRTVDVYTAPDAFTTLTESDTLNGGDVLPGFTLPVRAIFVNIPPTAPKRKKR